MISRERLQIGNNKARKRSWWLREGDRHWWPNAFGINEPNEQREIGLYRKTTKRCSCLGCGNPRNHPVKRTEQLTRQERIAELNMREQLYDMSSGKNTIHVWRNNQDSSNL